jgi:hypothetical protein
LKISPAHFALLSLAGLVSAPAPLRIRPPIRRRSLAQELALQGYRDHAVLARPHAHRRGTVDTEETREGVKVRERFARFGDLRAIELDGADSTSGPSRGSGDGPL